MAPTESFGTDALGFGGSGWQLLIRGSKVKDLAEAETKTKGYSDVRSACKTRGVNTVLWTIILRTASGSCVLPDTRLSSGILRTENWRAQLPGEARDRWLSA